MCHELTCNIAVRGSAFGTVGDATVPDPAPGLAATGGRAGVWRPHCAPRRLHDLGPAAGLPKSTNRPPDRTPAVWALAEPLTPPRRRPPPDGTSRNLRPGTS